MIIHRRETERQEYGGWRARENKKIKDICQNKPLCTGKKKKTDN